MGDRTQMPAGDERRAAQTGGDPESRADELVTAEPAATRSKRHRGAAIGAALAVGMTVGGGVAAALKAPAWPGLSSSQVGPPGSSADGSSPATGPASQGVVTVVAVLSGGLDHGVLAGTGMVLTSDGIVVTNNHVVDGESVVQVTDPATGKTYDATVVATDARADVAVLQITDASGLTTVPLDDDVAAGADDSGGTVYGDAGAVAGTAAATSTNGVDPTAYAIDVRDADAVAVHLLGGRRVRE